VRGILGGEGGTSSRTVARRNRRGVSPLGAFIHEVQAQAGKHLTEEEAEAILAIALPLQAGLGCS
jgi:AraC-like DNA-binding protein